MVENAISRSYFREWIDSPLFKRELVPTGVKDVVTWWESRRPFFNFVVAVSGLFTCGLLVICSLMADSMVGEPIGLPDPPIFGIFGVLAYGILANLFYISGWISELFLRAVLTAEKASTFGLIAFRIGVNLSILLTLCPAAMCWIVFAVALAKGQKQGPPGD